MEKALLLMIVFIVTMQPALACDLCELYRP